MCDTTKLASIATPALAALEPPVCMGQTPVPAPAPSISMPWLAGVSVDRARVSGGTTVRCTVSLLRPAVKPVVVGVTVSKTVQTLPMDPKNPLALPPWVTRQVTDVPAMLTVPTDSSSATFEIRTGSTEGTYGLPSARPCPATYTVTAVYGGERRQTGFEVSTEPCL